MKFYIRVAIGIIAVLGIPGCYAINCTVSSFEQALQHIPLTGKNIIVAIDVDNTLIQVKDYKGSSAHFDAMKKEFEKKEDSEGVAYNKTLELWSEIHKNIPIEVTEKTVVDVVRKLQQQENIVVFALTARPESMREDTLRELRSVGLDFSQKAPQAENVASFFLEETKMQRGNLEVTCKDGLCCSDNIKAQALMYIVARLKEKPDIIVMIDDRKPQLEDIEKVLDGHSAQFIGLHLDSAA